MSTATPASCPWADPGPEGCHLGVEDFPTFVIGHLSNALQREVTGSYLPDFGLTAPQWRLLAALAAYAPLPFGELVKLSMSDKALVSRTVQALAELGLARAEADPSGHGKKVVCAITPKGRALYRKVLPHAQRAQAQLLSVLEPAERTALYAALQKLRAGLAGGATIETEAAGP